METSNYHSTKLSVSLLLFIAYLNTIRHEYDVCAIKSVLKLFLLFGLLGITLSSNLSSNGLYIKLPQMYK